MRVPANHVREFRLASLVLVVFWSATAVLALVAWRIPAFILLVMGAAAACERLVRVLRQGSSRAVRAVAGLSVLVVVTVTLGLAFLVHPAFHRAGP